MKSNSLVKVEESNIPNQIALEEDAADIKFQISEEIKC
jgi:hypothetical protein